MNKADNEEAGQWEYFAATLVLMPQLPEGQAGYCCAVQTV